MMVVQCPGCAHRMKAPPSLMGKATNCLKCGERFQVTKNNATGLQRKNATASAPSQTQAAGPAAATGRSRVAQLLVERELVTEEQCREAEAIQAERGGRVYYILIELGHITRGDFRDLMSLQPGVASIELKNYQVDEQLASLIPEKFAADRMVLPVDKLGKMLTLGMACPFDTDTIQEIQQATQLRVNPVLCNIDDIQQALIRLYDPSASHADADFSWMGGVTAATRKDAPEEIAPTSATDAAVAEARPKRARPPEQEVATEEEVAEGIRNRERVSALLAQLNSLPVAPESLERAQAAAGDPSYPMRDLALICGTDPAVVAKLLSVGNSAAYGMPEQVDNANLATTLLGTAGTVHVVTGCANATSLEPAARFDYPAFLLQSRFAAAAAQAIAKATGKAPYGAASTGALLHKLGLLALAQVLPDQFGEVKPPVWGPARMKAERLRFGLTHPEAGFLVARNWRLPPAIAQAIRLHQSPEQAAEAGGVAAVVALAARMAELHSGDKGIDGFEGCEDLLKVLGMPQKAASDVYKNTTTMFEA